MTSSNQAVYTPRMDHVSSVPQASKVEYNPEAQLQCLDCGQRYNLGPLQRCSDCQGVLRCVYHQPLRLRSREGLWRFADVLPILPHASFPCPETPIRRIKAPDFPDYPLFGKVEGDLATGNTKYRQSCIAVPGLIAGGIREFVVSSTGNSASSFMYWAGRLQGLFRVHAFVPRLHRSRLRFANSYTTIHVTDVDFVETGQLARRFAETKGPFFEGGFFNPFRREGLKTSYMEGLLQLHGSVDYVFQAVSSGMGILGAHSAIEQLQQASLLQKTPKVICVQQDTCAPMVRADEQGYDHMPDYLIQHNPVGLAEAILRGNPSASYPYVRKVVKQTEGRFVCVTQEEIQSAFDFLRQHRIKACHTAATTYAAWRHMVQAGIIKPEERSMLMLTGS